MAADLSSQLPLSSGQPEVGSYHDLRSLNALRTLGQKDETAALRAAAKQFESVFMQMMMKSMREANESFEADDLFGSNDGDFYQQMHDEQLALALSEKQTFGLAELMVRQLQRNQGSAPANMPADGIAAPLSAVEGTAVDRSKSSGLQAPGVVDSMVSRNDRLHPESLRPESLRPETLAMFSPTHASAPANASLFAQGNPAAVFANGDALHPASANSISATGKTGAVGSAEEISLSAAATSGDKNSKEAAQLGFIKRLLPHAERAARSLGTSPMVLLAQAALETGWGQSQLAQADSARGNNFFGIKADGRWDGERVGKRTIEYSDGKPGWQQAWFRAYDSVASAFDDYVSFVKDSPRYSQAIAGAREPQNYLDGLVKGGYATDPQYARKVMSIAGSDRLAELVNQARELLANP